VQTKGEIIEQTKTAFDFIQKLYLEVSYLVKEIEGILQEEEEEFVIGRPSGYGISTLRSIGLESNLVTLWLVKKLAVFFVPKERTEFKGGQTYTKADRDLKVLYLRIVLNDKAVDEPTVHSGVFWDIQIKPQSKWKKFEHAMAHISYRDDKIFKDGERIEYEDGYLRFRGELKRNNLLEINDSETIVKRIIKPSLEIFRKR